LGFFDTIWTIINRPFYGLDRLGGEGWFGFLVFGFWFLVFVCDAGWLFWALRWHPRFAIGASGVAPVRGGTYFSLPPQRKVGKRKRLTPPTFLLA
jgi:hypothetical protein